MRSFMVVLMVALSCPLWAAHPLITDDPGTVAPGEIEFEQTVDFDEAQGFSNASTTFTTGLAHNLDAGIASGYAFTEDAGVATPNLALKWRFFGSADTGFSAALSTTTQFASSPFICEQVALLLGQYKTGASTFLLNAGRSWVVDDPDHWDWGVAVEYNTSPYTTLALEATDSDFIGNLPGFHNELEYLIGVIYTDSREYAYSAGIGYSPIENIANWRLTAGITITY